MLAVGDRQAVRFSKVPWHVRKLSIGKISDPPENTSPAIGHLNARFPGWQLKPCLCLSAEQREGRGSNPYLGLGDVNHTAEMSQTPEFRGNLSDQSR